MRYKLAIGVMAALTSTQGHWDSLTGCWDADGQAFCPRPPLYASEQSERADIDARARCEARFGANVCAGVPGE